MIPFAYLLLAQTPGFSDPNAVQKQIGLCINALGYEKPTEPPKFVVKLKDKYVITWGPFEAELASRGVLTQFRLVNQNYKLAKSTHFPGTGNSTNLQHYLTQFCNAAGMLQPASNAKLSVTVDGKQFSVSSVYKPSQYKSIQLALTGRDNSGDTVGLCSIQCSATDGAITYYNLGHSDFALDSARIVGTFKLKK